MKSKLLYSLIFFLAFAPLFGADEDVPQNAPENVAQEVAEIVDDAPDIAAVDNLGVQGFVSEGEFGREHDEQIDPKVLRDFVEGRGLIACRQKCGQLTIAGDVRARWTASGEKLKGIKQRGAGTNTAIHRFRGE